MNTSGELHVVFGSGPVGQAVVETLLAQGKPVRAVSRGGARRSLPASVEVVRADPDPTVWVLVRGEGVESHLDAREATRVVPDGQHFGVRPVEACASPRARP